MTLGAEILGIDLAQLLTADTRFLSQAYARGRAAPLPCAARRANNVRTMARLYTRTDAGRKAWDTQNGLVALDCRRVLGLVGRDTDPRDLRAKLGWSESAVNDILQELEEGGLVKSVETAPSGGELDFTGNFLLADIEAAQQRIREDLDFTGPLSADVLRAAREKK